MKKAILFSIIIFVFIGVFSYFRVLDIPSAKNGEDINITIEKGESVKEISQKLFDRGLIKSKFYFEIYLWQTKNESKIKAGRYILNPILSIKEISNILLEGRAENEKIITLLEGWNNNEIANYFETNKIFSRDEFLKIAGYSKADNLSEPESAWLKDYSEQFEFLKDKPKNYGLEGYLFPDTYRIFIDSSVEDVVLKILNNFDKKLDQKMRNDIESQNKTIFDIVKMASIIEKEVRTEEDMKIVSGIFWQRIKNGQALQSCASLAYILGENKVQYSIEDTQVESPFNTYKYKGLPPAPVSNPGLIAIKAAIYPEITEYNYFLNEPELGKTIFSKTYEEHLSNKIKYLK